uniref:Ribosomal protein S3 n=1 Tax=Melanothamnus gigas TaxID=3016206 RepID=A0A9F1U5B5_9FLOR|nr:Ribosomal protein S3 [Melanothamnus gigas]WAX04156.1 Ribosomal protein S3 [Melanothamnus gigas]
MSKKINLSGKCLALTNLWVMQFQHFGNFTSLFSKYTFLFLIFKFFLFKQLNLKNNFFVLDYKFFILKNEFFIVLTNFFKNFNEFNYFFNLLSSIWFKNFNFLSFRFLIFFKKTFYLSSDFLQSYISYLSKKLFYSPKKIFTLLFILLKKKLNQSILTTTKNGLKRKKIIGFKMQLRGRYELTKTAMAKITQIKFGKINSTDLKINVTFMNYFFYTKLGNCSIKIWLFSSF